MIPVYKYYQTAIVLSNRNCNIRHSSNTYQHTSHQITKKTIVEKIGNDMQKLTLNVKIYVSNKLQKFNVRYRISLMIKFRWCWWKID